MPEGDAVSTFEGSLQELEAIVERLERGDLSLEESLQAFERGITLTRSCQRALDDAVQRVEILTRESGVAPSTQPFQEGND